MLWLKTCECSFYIKRVVWGTFSYRGWYNLDICWEMYEALHFSHHPTRAPHFILHIVLLDGRVCEGINCLDTSYHQTHNISHTKFQLLNVSRLVLQLPLPNPLKPGDWRCSWSSADMRCSNYIWVINNFIDYWGVTYIRGLMVCISKRTVDGINLCCFLFFQTWGSWFNLGRDPPAQLNYATTEWDSPHCNRRGLIYDKL